MAKLKYHQRTYDLLGKTAKKSPQAVKQIAARERKLKFKLPASLKEWYSQEGAVKTLYKHSNQDEPVALGQLGDAYELTHGVLKIQTENQGVAKWYVRLDGSDDPPVEVDSEFNQDPNETWDEEDDFDYLARVKWQRQSPTFSEYVFQRVLQYGGTGNVRELAQRIKRLGGAVFFDRQGKLDHVAISEDCAAEAVFDLLSKQSLRELDLYGPSIESNAWEKKLGGLSRLALLRAAGESFDDNALFAASGLRGLREIHLHGTGVTNRGFRDALQRCQLKVLVLRTYEVADAGLSALARQASLEHVDIDDMDVTSRGLKHLAALDRLKGLRVRELPIGDSALRHLSRLPALKWLWIHDIPITDKGLRHLAQLPQLGELELRGTEITGKGLRHLTGLPKLHTLSLQETLLTDVGIPAICEMSKLRRINVRHCKLTEDGISALRKARPRLEIETDEDP